MLVVAMFVFLGLGLMSASAAEKLANADCLDCHPILPTAARWTANRAARRFSRRTPFPSPSTRSWIAWIATTASKTWCTRASCRRPIAPCATRKRPRQYAASIHGVSHALGASGAANCWDCHGSHDIVPVKQHGVAGLQAEPPANLRQVPQQSRPDQGIPDEVPGGGGAVQDSIHGRALLKMGLIVAPSCNDCHGVHDIKRDVDRDSPINHANIAKTCGKCHVRWRKSTTRAFTASCWPRATSAGRSAPIATPRTQVEPPRTAISKWPATRGAANATRTGSNIIATPTTAKPWRWANRTSPRTSPRATTATATTTCCRRPIPASRLSKTNILATCQQCHPGATAGFTEYQPHANPLDKENYPLLHVVFLGMTGLLIGVFTFFGAAHPRLAGTRHLPLSARHEDIPRSQDPDADWTTNGSRVSCRSSASCISWS